MEKPQNLFVSFHYGQVAFFGVKKSCVPLLSTSESNKRYKGLKVAQLLAYQLFFLPFPCFSKGTSNGVHIMCHAKFKNICVSTVYVGDEAAPFMPDNYNNHRVSIYNSKTHKRTSFKFWASIISPELRTRYDALNALYCFVGDAVSGLDSFENFCGNFGYDIDSRTAYKTWQACQRSTDKALRVLGVSRSELYDFLNELSAIAA